MEGFKDFIAVFWDWSIRVRKLFCSIHHTIATGPKSKWLVENVSVSLWNQSIRYKFIIMKQSKAQLL